MKRRLGASAAVVALVAAGAYVGSSSGCLDSDRSRPAGAACDDDGDCAGSLVCVYGRCRAECLLDGDCPDGEACVPDPGDPARRVCTTSAEDCRDGSFDCSEMGLVCDTETGVCRQGCSPSDPCPPGYACDQDRGVCISAPPADGDADADTDADGDATGDAESDGDRDRDGTIEDAEAGPCTPLDPVCDLWPQCGCDPGETCVPPEEVGESRDCLVAGGRAIGLTCSYLNDCEVGALCHSYGDGGPVGICRQLCVDGSHCGIAGDGSVCAAPIFDTAGAEVARLCTLECDPLRTVTICPPGTWCDLVLDDVALEWGTACIAGAGTGGIGDACGWPSGDSCQPGLFCDLDRGPSCQRLCNIAVTDGCPGAAECFAPDSYVIEVSGVTYGTCAGG